MFIPPILDNKRTSKPSVFAPAALLGEARRQKGLDSLEVPPVCILDPDGDLARRLRQTGLAMPFSGTSFWPTWEQPYADAARGRKIHAARCRRLCGISGFDAGVQRRSRIIGQLRTRNPAAGGVASAGSSACWGEHSRRMAQRCRAAGRAARCARPRPGQGVR